MRIKPLYALSAAGLLLGLGSAYLLGRQSPAQPPLFHPASNPYADGIYANGIVESLQGQGEQMNLYPEVSGVVSHVLAREGQAVRAGAPLLTIDDSVQRATTAQLSAQADAARGTLDELRAEPRRETLEVARAQVGSARATLRNIEDQLDKQQRSYRLDPRSVSRDALDTAIDNEKIARAGLDVAQRQYDLTRAGAWSYDIRNQERQADASRKAYLAASALLAKYVVRAPVDGVVLSLHATVGSYASPQGVYDAYTQADGPVAVMGTPQRWLAVRAYVDEILVHRLPDPAHIAAQMTIRGTDIHVPLGFVRVQPYVSPKIELSDQRQERVDVRVLPVIFRFRNTPGLKVYPGQIVDVYIGARGAGARG